jgi:hypothetical protein
MFFDSRSRPLGASMSQCRVFHRSRSQRRNEADFRAARISTKVFTAWAMGAACWAAQPCAAATIADPSGDILSTYAGQVGPDLDILQFTVDIQGGNFLFEVLLNGAPGTTPLAKYNIGIDRGAGTNTFPIGFRPDASEDAVINLVPATQAGEVRLFEGGIVVTTTPLASGAITISGNTISALVPMSMLPSTGFAPDDYTFLLWSRTQLAPGVPQQFGIADFAPDQGLLSSVPEPSTWVIMLLGFGAIGFAMRRPGLSLHAAKQSA